MSQCVELIQIAVKPRREEEFLSIEKVRFAEMRKKNAQLERRMFKLPFCTRTYVVCTTWPSRDEAVRYAGERFQRDRFHQFLAENVEALSIHFVDEVDLSSLDGVPAAVEEVYAH